MFNLLSKKSANFKTTWAPNLKKESVNKLKNGMQLAECKTKKIFVLLAHSDEEFQLVNTVTGQKLVLSENALLTKFCLVGILRNSNDKNLKSQCRDAQLAFQNYLHDFSKRKWSEQLLMEKPIKYIRS